MTIFDLSVHSIRYSSVNSHRRNERERLHAPGVGGDEGFLQRLRILGDMPTTRSRPNRPRPPTPSPRRPACSRSSSETPCWRTRTRPTAADGRGEDRRPGRLGHAVAAASSEGRSCPAGRVAVAFSRTPTRNAPKSLSASCTPRCEEHVDNHRFEVPRADADQRLRAAAEPSVMPANRNRPRCRRAR